ncbi:signal transduction histidine kinase [Salibacterium salarium]|uniref:7TM diverse intracellular signaling domain-containing protein n=1 Tax=Salibacterium salarium TaxID=284579 RepID=UPI002783CF5D|nr:7TM diverse intracellular signaling domain-containing protein [Salibacterium salarium]MDQ0299324.1 signal transduction histidine kinase [Salibacterium salarium]
MRKKWLAIFLSILLFLIIQSNVKTTYAMLQLDEEQTSYDMTHEMELLEDADGILSINDVVASTDNFAQNKSGIPNFGYTESDYWIHFQLNNTSSLEEWVLEIEYPPHDSITLFEQREDGSFMQRESGDHLPFEKRDINHRNFAFELDIPKGEINSYYIKIDSQGSMQLPLKLWEEDTFSEKSQTEYIILGIYYGLAAVMILYNLFLFFSLRLRSYIWYVLFIFSLVLTHLTLNGLAFQFLWPESMWWNNRAIVFFIAASQGLALLFVKSFLNTKVHTPKMNKFFSVFAVIQLIILMILMVSYENALNLAIGSSVLLVISVLMTAGLCWKRGYRPARYFFVGWVIFLIGVLISSLADAGIIPITFYTKYASQMGSALEIVLFSLALADKFNVLRTEKERAERKSRESQEEAVKQLKRANSLKDEFLANTSHELRTPLNGIIGIAESMYDAEANRMSPPHKNNLSMIIRSGKRLSHLVNDLLDFSKLKHKDIELERKPVQLNDAVQVVLSISEPFVKNKDVTLINNLPGDLPFVLADENRLQQILYNLIGNAIKFTDVGSITVSAYSITEYVIVKVKDTGVGMTAEDKASMFCEFEQGQAAKNQQQGGTGLGLSITKKLVELHGGDISVESELSKGTTVHVQLPTSTESKAAPSSVNVPLYEEIGGLSVDYTAASVVEAGKGRILIADDEPVNIQVLWNQLTQEGYEVTTAYDGEEVLQRIDAEETFDLIILDVMMPKKSGYEVSQTLREHYTLTELPILILTARNQLEDIVTAFSAGANDYLSKPCYKEELLARVHTLLTLEQVMEEAVEQKENLHDVNEQLASLNKELENRVKDRTTELERKTNELLKMEKSRRHLLSNISHELGTPMTSLQGYVKAMMDGIISSDDANYLSLIYKKVLFIDRLIQDLYDLSKLEARQVSFWWKKISVKQFIYEFLLPFRTEAESHHLWFSLENNYDYPAYQEVLSVDTDRLEQVITNIIYNAMKHSDGEAAQLQITVTPSTIFFSHEEKYYTKDKDYSKEQYLESDHRNLIIGVHDNGNGIASDSLPFIFDRFFRGESSRTTNDGSTGLGLAISKEIIEYHGGEIWAESVKGKGSSFYIALPLYTDDKK